MILCKKHYAKTIMLFFLVLTWGNFVYAQSEKGLHFTPEEVKIWRQRTISGPYKNAGDAGPNSPGDWSRILKQANEFLANPSRERFRGGDGNYNNEPRQNHVKMKDAAFVYLLTKDRKYFDAVRKELLAQIQVSGTDPSRWAYVGDMGRWVSAEWVSRLLFAYDYIKSDLSASDRSLLNQWFAKAGKYFATNIHRNLVTLFPNRLNQDYSVRGSDAKSGRMRSEYTHINKNGTKGNHISYLSSWYNNRRSVQMRAVGLIGAFLNDENLKFQAKLYVKEMLMFSTYPDGTMGEYERNGNYGNPQAGMTYSSFNIQAAIDIADVLARKGDFELYKYSTSKGLHGTEGGNKSIRLLVENYYKQTDLSTERYYRSVNIRNRIDSENEFGGSYGIERWTNDVWYAPANIYWKNDYFKRAYTRQTGPGYPSKNLAGCGSVNYPWGGLGGSYPGVLFMFGQMEGKVWPYSGSGSQNSGSEDQIAQSIAAPSGLTATALSGTEVRLTWKDNSKNESSFVLEVSSSSGSGFSTLRELPANSTVYTHTGLQPGMVRYYRIKAKNGSNHSGYSNVSSSTTKGSSNTNVPAAPTHLTSKAGSAGGTIHMYWYDNSNNETAFVVEVSSSKNGNFSVLKEIAPNSTSYIHSGLPSGATRYYRVRAKNKSGYSNYTNVSYSTTKGSATAGAVPKAPTHLTSKAGLAAGTIHMYWYDNSNNETAFVVEVSSSKNGGFKVLKEIAPNSTAYTHSGLPSGATRYYRVRAKNKSGYSNYTNVSYSTTKNSATNARIAGGEDEEIEIFMKGDSLYTNINGSHQWILNGKTIKGANSNYYIPLMNGEYSVTVLDEDGGIFQSENRLVMNARKAVNIFPNPSQGRFKVEVFNPEGHEYEMIVYSSMNEALMRRKLSVWNGNNVLDDIDLQRFGRGMYLIKILRPGIEPVVERVWVR